MADDKALIVRNPALRRDPDEQPYAGELPTGEELDRVRAGIKALRTLAVKPDWWTAPTSRRATPLEIAVSVADRKPHHCTGHSGRTGLACTAYHKLGMVVCRKHGGSIEHVKKKAKIRLAVMVDTVVERLLVLANQNDHLPTALGASKAILERILPASRREESEKKTEQTGPVIQIGVSMAGTGQPVIAVSAGKPQKRIATVKEGEVTE